MAKGFDVAVIEKVLKIAEHHDALRMVYRFEAENCTVQQGVGEGEVSNSMC